MSPILVTIFLAATSSSSPAPQPSPKALLGAFPAEREGPASRETLREPDANRTELGLVPFIGGSTDIGVAVGALGSLVKFDELRAPYRFGFDLFALISFRSIAGTVEVPFQGYHLQLIVPD